LRFGIEPLEIQNALICDLKNRCCKQIENQSDLSREVSASRQAVFNQGQKVEITSGLFKDYQAIFKQFDGEARVIIILNLLNQQQELLVELEQLHTFL
jgi:transcription antitermination factor NusG